MVNEVRFQGLSGYVTCPETDGRMVQIQYRYMTSAPQQSDYSANLTAYCAGYPDAPEMPVLVIGNRDIIELSWSEPTYDGGSPITGFQLYMMEDIDVDGYTLIGDYINNPIQTTYTSNLDHFGQPLRPATYLFAVEAQNIVGIGAKSEA